MTDKIKVLMVDDEEQFRATTSRILTKRGYHTTVAASGEEAMGILEKDPHDVVILDIKMPGMDGHAALSRIKTLRPDAQVIMLTGHGSRESAEESLEHKAFDYLNKPCDTDLLDTRIREAYAAAHKEMPREEKRARDIMIPIEDYTTLQADSTVQEGIEGLLQSFKSMASTSRIMETGHRSILVFEGRELAGILSIRDLISALQPAYLTAPKPSMADSMVYSTMFWTGLFTRQARNLKDKRVRDLMSGPPLTVDEEANLMEVANTLYSERVRRLVVKSKKKVIGIVREQDLFFELARIILGA
ncbi:MAG: response regulator [Deltaproteobacteria bacterium]|nr:response regulator [Deltaproteobacteria bacterium]